MLPVSSGRTLFPLEGRAAVYSVRRRGTTRYSIEPSVSSSSARGELLLARRRAIARKLVQDASELRRDQNAEVLVGRVLRDFVRNEYLHLLPLFVFADLTLQFHQELFYSIGYFAAARPLQRFCVNDARYRPDGGVQVVVDHHVLVEI